MSAKGSGGLAISADLFIRAWGGRMSALTAAGFLAAFLWFANDFALYFRKAKGVFSNFSAFLGGKQQGCLGKRVGGAGQRCRRRRPFRLAGGGRPCRRLGRRCALGIILPSRPYTIERSLVGKTAPLPERL